MKDHGSGFDFWGSDFFFAVIILMNFVFWSRELCVNNVNSKVLKRKYIVVYQPDPCLSIRTNNKETRGYVL